MSNSISVQLIQGPLDSDSRDHAAIGCGAQVVFDGIVRPQEEGAPIIGLKYEAYEPMTTRELMQLAERMIAKHGVSRICVEHSVGLVPVGKVSFRLIVESKHRKEGLQATDEFIDEMKRVVPLWKMAVHGQ